VHEAPAQLSRRERQIMDILLELGEATAEEVRRRLPDPPSYSAARALLSKLEAKGHVRHAERDLRYVYRPAISRDQARQSAVARLVKVFFGGSLADAVSGLVGMSDGELSAEEIRRIRAAIDASGKKAGPA
jgi:BlaI family transcriptional regulator, penicillinase repressor